MKPLHRLAVPTRGTVTRFLRPNLLSLRLLLLAGFLSLCGLITPLFAEIPLNERVSLDGEIRYRTEIDGRDFNSATGMAEYSSLRSQLGVRIQASDAVSLRFTFKDSRYLGTTGSNATSTSFVDLQEGYISIDRFLSSPLTLQLGRFEMLYGRRRVMGNGDWNNFGPRTYDGGRLRWSRARDSIDLFYAKIVERSFTNQRPYTNDLYSTQDRILAGVAGKFLHGLLQPLYTLDWDERVLASDPDVVPDVISTFALFIPLRRGGFALDLDGGYQMGSRQAVSLNVNEPSRTVSSWLFSTDGTYTMDVPGRLMVGFGLDATSGSSLGDLARGKVDHAFYTPFMSRHRYRGYMDYFQDESAGLIDRILHIGIEPIPSFKLNVDGHEFSYQRTRLASGGKEYILLGQELDIRFRAPLAKGVGFDAAYCRFIPTSEWKPGGDPGVYIYGMITATF